MNSDTLFYIFMFVCICVHVGYLNTTKIYYDAKNVATSNQCNEDRKSVV